MNQENNPTNGTCVLVADDDAGTRLVLRHTLERRGFDVLVAEDGRQVMERINDEIAVAVIDLRMPHAGGLECLRYIQNRHPDTQTIMITATRDVKDAVAAMKAGAFDYITKPFHPEELASLVRQAARAVELVRENRRLREAMSDHRPPSPLIGKSDAVRDLTHKIHRIAELEATALITGESGTGKSLAARLIHFAGPRADMPFVSVNCMALPRELMESELFGHEAGAFNGAVQRRIGRVELADGGTLFLDGVGAMPMDLQAKLLSFLENQTYSRAGENTRRKTDVRVIAATDQDLKSLCRKREFLEDLFFRLNVIPLHLTPLRERPEDLEPLASHILERIRNDRRNGSWELDRQALRVMRQYDWPGNVRELENALEWATAFCERPRIRREDLPPRIFEPSGLRGRAPGAFEGMTLRQMEREAIEQTLRAVGGNKAEAARRLGISEKSIYNKMRRLGVSSPNGNRGRSGKP